MALNIDKIFVEPIGLIYIRFENPLNVPIQSQAAHEIPGIIEIFPKYSEGLKDLEGFSYLILIYYFHKIKESKLQVKPFLDEIERGVYSTRAPIRPNHLGISLVKLNEIDNNMMKVQGIDIVDRTPLLDIKPFIPTFDIPRATKDKIKIGWLTDRIHQLDHTLDDGRFYSK